MYLYSTLREILVRKHSGLSPRSGDLARFKEIWRIRARVIPCISLLYYKHSAIPYKCGRESSIYTANLNHSNILPLNLNRPGNTHFVPLCSDSAAFAVCSCNRVISSSDADISPRSALIYQTSHQHSHNAQTKHKPHTAASLLLAISCFHSFLPSFALLNWSSLWWSILRFLASLSIQDGW